MVNLSDNVMVSEESEFKICTEGMLPSAAINCSLVPVTDDSSPAPRPKRERRQSQAYTTVEPDSKYPVIEIGDGIILSEYPYFLKALDKIKAEDKLLRSLSNLLFNCVIKKSDAKRNIRAFSGFSSATNLNEKILQVTKYKEKWTVELLIAALQLFGLDESGERDELIRRLIYYLQMPTILKDESLTPRPKTDKILRIKTKGTKRKSSPKNPVSAAYVLFSLATRDEVRAHNSEASYTFVAKTIDELWRALDAVDRQQWSLLAEEENLKIVAEEEQEAVQQEYESIDEKYEKYANNKKDDDLFDHSDIYGDIEYAE